MNRKSVNLHKKLFTTAKNKLLLSSFFPYFIMSWKLWKNFTFYTTNIMKFKKEQKKLPTEIIKLTAKLPIAFAWWNVKVSKAAKIILYV